jgi:beta-carotene 15,15'-dioxygenase
MSSIVTVRWSNRDRTMFGLLPPFVLLILAIIELRYPFSVALAGWPFSLSLILIGLPHGAVDLSVSSRLSGVTTWSESLRGFVSYIILLVLVLAAAFTMPTAVIIAFGLMSAWHFGTADALDLNESVGKSCHVNWLVAAARGSFVLSLPFVFHPTSTCEVANRLLHMFGSNGANVSEAIVKPVFVGILCLAFVVLFVDWCFRISTGAIQYAGILFLEIASLVAAFAILHPLFAMGSYFLCWHSWRQTRRLIFLMEGESVSISRSVILLHVRSLPLLIPTLMVVAAVLIWALPDATIYDLAVVALAVFVVVTPPHQILISRLQGNM